MKNKTWEKKKKTENAGKNNQLSPQKSTPYSHEYSFTATKVHLSSVNNRAILDLLAVFTGKQHAQTCFFFNLVVVSGIYRKFCTFSKDCRRHAVKFAFERDHRKTAAGIAMNKILFSSSFLTLIFCC